MGKVLIALGRQWTPSDDVIASLNDLGRALSCLVARCVDNEIINVRDIELQEAKSDVLHRLLVASEYRDNDTGMHITRMAHYSGLIARSFGLTARLREKLVAAAPMHDVGKIGISDAILYKPGKLTAEEFDIMKTHTGIGERILKGDDSLISTARDIAANHHEHWNGAGYPRGLSGETIPTLARICSVADVFDALTSARPYKDIWPVEEAVDWIKDQAGQQFDPEIVDAFVHALPEILRVKELYRDAPIDPYQTLNIPQFDQAELPWIPWEDDLSVGIDVIDEHHRFLFHLTNDLIDVISTRQGSRQIARVLRSLDQYAHIHFQAEEKMMEYYGCSSLHRQAHEHQRFRARLREFFDEFHKNPLTAQLDILDFLKNWLVHHIRYEDSKLRELVERSPE
jgi:hemerythrin-like metal-binding protein